MRSAVARFVPRPTVETVNVLGTRVPDANPRARASVARLTFTRQHSGGGVSDQGDWFAARLSWDPNAPASSRVRRGCYMRGATSADPHAILVTHSPAWCDEGRAMSDGSQGPGWWIASDGKWYPPHLHPNYQAHPQAEAQAASAHATAPRRPLRWSQRGRSSSKRYGLILAAAILVVVVIVAVGSGSHNPKSRPAPNTAPTSTTTAPAPQWVSVAVPAVTTNSTLQGVACPSSVSCVAVGSSSTAKYAHTSALVEVWNGASWSIKPFPASVGRRFDSISCASTASCVAVGSYSPIPTHSVPFSAVWDGHQWSVEAAVVRPEPNSHFSTTLQSVSCASASFCVAVGSTVTPTGVVTLAEIWNGANWSLVNTPNSSSEKNNTFTAVSCVSSSVCMAVGYDYNAVGSAGAPIAMSWNGSAWSLVLVPSQGAKSALYSVSCTSPTACEATGTTFAVRWNGTAWATQSVATSRRPVTVVSCFSGTCQAVGGYPAKTLSTPSGLFAEGWHGSSWIRETITAAGKRLPTPHGMSCARPSMCMMVGNYTKSAPKSEQFYTTAPYAPLAEEFSR